jgi:hypothetical protein
LIACGRRCNVAPVDPEQTRFAEPAAGASVPRAGGPAPHAGARPPTAGSVLSVFVSPRRLATLAAAGIAACALLGWLGVGVELAHLLQVRTQLAGTPVEPSQQAMVETAQRIIQGVKLGVVALAALAFLAWLYRLRVNVRALGMRRLSYTRQWSVLAFLVPVLNFVRPYQVMAEIWQASDPAVLDPFEWRSAEPPRLLGRWWATCVLAATLQLAAWGLSLSTGGVAFKALLAGVAAIVADVMLAVSASLAYFVVMRLTDTQLAKAELLRAGAESA